MRIIPGILFLVLTTAAVTTERIKTLDDILAYQQKAQGEPLHSLELELAINENDNDLTAKYLARRDDRMRIDVFADGEKVFSEALNGDAGWQRFDNASAPAPLSAEGEAALRRGIVGNLFSIRDRQSLGYRLSYVDTESIDGQCFWLIKSIAKDGFTELFYINTRTGLIDRKYETSALHPDLDSQQRQSVTHFSDYRNLGDRWLSFRMAKLDAVSGEKLQQVTVVKATSNPKLPDSRFSAALD